MTRLTEILLRQKPDETLLDMASSLSDDFDLLGCRGLVVWVPGAWTAADVGFIFKHGSIAQLLRNSTGNPVAITGIATAAAYPYVAPSAVWGLGGAVQAQLASINISGTGVLVTQAAARQLKVFRLY